MNRSSNTRGCCSRTSAANFVAANMFERIPLDPETVYSLVILMPGRLLEVDAEAASRLRAWLHGHFQHLLIYAYGEWLTRYQGLEGLAERAGLDARIRPSEQVDRTRAHFGVRTRSAASAATWRKRWATMLETRILS